MWTAAAALIILASLVPLSWQLRRLRGDRLTIAAILLIWVRFALSTLGEFAVATTVAGQSLVSLGTLAAVAAAALILPLRLLRSGWALPFYGFVALGTVSAAMNGALGQLQEFLVIWVYFLLIAILLYRGLRLHGTAPVLGCLLAAYALPLAAQLLSVALDLPKVGQDGTLNYIGGYRHEAVFSLVAFGGLWAAALYPWQRTTALIALGLGALSLLLGNYRTMLLAAAPLLLAGLVRVTGARLSNILERGIAVVAVVVIVVPLLMPQGFSERFSDIALILSSADELAQRPEEFTAAEKDILSARVYLWSVYFYSVADADLPQLLLGHGPGLLAERAETHPHNDYLFVLHQFGIVGALAWYAILVSHLLIAARAEPRLPGLITAAGFLGLFVAAMGTSPFSRPEGVIVLATLCAMTWHLAAAPRRSAGGAAERAPHAARRGA